MLKALARVLLVANRFFSVEILTKQSGFCFHELCFPYFFIYRQILLSQIEVIDLQDYLRSLTLGFSSVISSLLPAQTILYRQLNY